MMTAEELKANGINGECLQSDSDTSGDFKCSYGSDKPQGATHVMIEKPSKLRLNNVGIYAGYDCANYNWIIRDNTGAVLDGKSYSTTERQYRRRLGHTKL